MKNAKIFIVLISTFLFLKIYTLRCEEEEIENCLKCGTGENSNRCDQCEDNYFPFLFNYLCLPCDHMQYGDSGCLGKCYMNYNNNNYDLTCDEFGCKEGFYSLDKKTCINCNSFNTANCAKCSNLPPDGKTPAETDDRIFKCNECINDSYRVDSNGKCRHCFFYNRNCAQCHYLENSSNSVCDRCYYGYYLRNGECVNCRKIYINGGICSYCTDIDTDYQNIYCSCYKYYTKSSVTTCTSCPDNCISCKYNSNYGRALCKNCFTEYALTSQGFCTYCGKGCQHCTLDRNENPICTLCYSGYELRNGECYNCPINCATCHLENDEYICDKCFNLHIFDSDKKCVSCPSDCSSCQFNANGNIICTSCFTYSTYIGYYPKYYHRIYYYIYYALNGQSLCKKCPEVCNDCFWKESKQDFGCKSCRYSNYVFKDDECIKCSTIPELGEGCDYCNYNSYLQKFQCTGCLNNNYAFISNMNECILNDENALPNLHGCLQANYNQMTNKYECSSCKYGFIIILNEKSCKLPQEANLQSYCIQANNIGTILDPIYSCSRCNNTFYAIVDIIDYRGAHDCYRRINDLNLCEAGTKDEAGVVQCTKCIGNFEFVFSSIYNKEVCDLICQSDSFKKNYWCYKCDDKYVGNPGCIKEKGCKYYSDNDELDCNECKIGYFEYTTGQCFQCKFGNPQCVECHFNTSFECDKCIDGYFVNDEKKCQLITCDEHPEVMPGCIICSDKLKEFSQAKKCQACREEFFKTKDETCVYCKAKKNGGPACEVCEYAIDEEGKETKEIRCKFCAEGSFLTSDGKCYSCKDELEDGCQNCTLLMNEADKSEKLICTKCINDRDFNLTSNNHCIHANSFAEMIPHCYYQYNYIYHYIPKNDISTTTPDIDLNEGIENNEEDFIDSERYEIKSYCEYCKEGYSLFYEENCLPFDISNCSLFSIYSNFQNFNETDYKELYQNYRRCNEICHGSKYVQIDYYYEVEEEVNITTVLFNETLTDNYNETIDQDKDKDKDYTEYTETHTEIRTFKRKIYFEELFYEDGKHYFEMNNQIMNIITKGYICLDNLGKGNKLSPINLRKCSRAEYIESNDTYICLSCIEGYSLDNETNTCKQSIQVSMNLRPGFDNCYVRNIGTYSNPIYSCTYCFDSNYVLATSESGANFCVPKEGELEGCTRAYVNTTYLNNVYNCTSCKTSYIPYYNIFFDKIICQNIYTEPDKKRELDTTAFFDVENVDAINGVCENNKLFTPDGIKCYACNNRTVGMVGCKGACTFNLKKNISLKCEDDKCKTGFIEKTRGVCEPCETINEGCIECHYENNYLKGYYGLKRKRRFSCDQCDNGYLRSEDGTCHHCSTLGFTNCKNCDIDKDHDNEIVCVECNLGYFLNSEGKCTICYENHIRSKNNNCITCDDVDEGGIYGCETCSNNENNEPKCTACKPGFILEEDGKNCLRITSNAELEELTHCILTARISSHYVCRKCDSNFVLLQENNNIRCFPDKYIPTPNPSYCEIFVNLGTEDQPKYSCSKCNTRKFEDFDFTRITFKENDTAYCELNNKYSSLGNSTEATMIIENGVKILNCSACIEDNILFYHVDTDLNICKYKYFEKQCVVKYCKTCRPGNNYFCQECLPSDYEVSSLTGGCILKADRAPAVHFKDIFRLKFNQQKQIGGRILLGPFLSLRGLTNSQINTGHAFMVLLSFTLHYTRNNRNRNLEEEKNVKTYCQIVESMDYTTDETNMVDFDCIGDTEEGDDFSDYDLNSIKESPENNKGVFENSNLDELAEETDLKNLQFKLKSSYELKDFVKLTTFVLDTVPTFTSKDYHFVFTLNGNLTRNLSKMSFDAKLSVSQIKNKSVICKFNVKEEKQADLNCDVDFEEYKNEYSEFSFKVTTIDHNDESIFLTRINEVRLVHEEKKNYTAIIIIVVVIVVAAAGIISGVIIYKKKKKIIPNEENNQNNNNDINNQNNNNDINNQNNNNNESNHTNQPISYSIKGAETSKKIVD